MHVCSSRRPRASAIHGKTRKPKGVPTGFVSNTQHRVSSFCSCTMKRRFSDVESPVHFYEFSEEERDAALHTTSDGGIEDEREVILHTTSDGGMEKELDTTLHMARDKWMKEESDTTLGKRRSPAYDKSWRDGR
ncbi:hypothetical protein G5714_011291 [Onychostoma macrolepis]|uniref:Uncharacterized protein n=1 Tax=Onychostoma macrolepis TaxID=369639 RepID=A0A7J6CRX9_9TELE|nr:hypothetical protein G5714_011291 [Onychostoma macrolepis]